MWHKRASKLIIEAEAEEEVARTGQRQRLR